MADFLNLSFLVPTGLDVTLANKDNKILKTDRKIKYMLSKIQVANTLVST